MKRKIPLWSILFVLAVFFTGYSIYQIASTQTNTTFALTTIAGNPSSLSPITLTTKIDQTDYPYDYWDISYDFFKGSISKTFHDGIYDEHYYTPELPTFPLETDLLKYYQPLGSGKYCIRDLFPTLPLTLSVNRLNLAEIKDNEPFPYIQITTPSSWILEVEINDTMTSVSVNYGGFSTQIEPLLLNDRIFFTIPTAPLHQLEDDTGTKELQFTGISGIFEITTSYTDSDQVSYDELIDCTFKVPISNTGTTDVLKLIPLEERNSLALLLLENNKDFRVVIYQLDTNQVVSDTIVSSLEEVIDKSIHPSINGYIKDDTLLISYSTSKQMVSDEEAEQLRIAAEKQDEVNQQLFDQYYADNKEEFMEKYGQEEYEEFLYKEFYSNHENISLWDAYYAIFYEDFEFLICQLNENGSTSTLQKFSFTDLSSQGLSLSSSPNRITDWLHHENTSYLLLRRQAGEDMEEGHELYLLVVEGNTLKYYGRTTSDIYEDYSIGSTVYTDNSLSHQNRYYIDSTIAFH